MTTHNELLEILANGENSGVEFKRDDLSTQDLAKELVAFSNLAGGIVLLGVEDDGSVTGLNRDNLEEWVMNVCRDKIKPEIVPFFEVVRDVKNGNDIAIVRVTPGYDVHALWHHSTKRYLMRVGTQSREASQEELARLFQRRGLVRAELRPVSGSTYVDLDQRRLRNYFSDIRQQDIPSNEDQDAWESLLFNTEIITKDGVSVGGMLLFGKTPNRFLPHAGIDAVAYPGTEQDYDAREHTTLRGPITPLLDKAGNILENGLVEQALDFIQRNTPVVVETLGGRRVACTTYPRDALREGIVNALIHRDYLLTNTNVELTVYSNRLEITSPGRPPNGITPERMRSGTRAARNQLLKDMMRDYRYLENMGMGIPRKIIKGMKEHNNTEPDLVEQDEQFTLRLHKKDSEEHSITDSR